MRELVVSPSRLGPSCSMARTVLLAHFGIDINAAIRVLSKFLWIIECLIVFVRTSSEEVFAGACDGTPIDFVEKLT